MKGSRADAKTYALKLLSYRARSKREMLEKLQRKGFDSRQINNTIKFLEDSGLIDDKALVRDLFKHSVERKYLGERGIRMFLLKRGIDRNLIEETLSTHSAEMEERAAGQLAERKLRTLKNYPAEVVRRRLWGMLQRRGFSADVIKRVISSID